MVWERAYSRIRGAGRLLEKVRVEHVKGRESPWVSGKEHSRQREQQRSWGRCASVQPGGHCGWSRVVAGMRRAEVLEWVWSTVARMDSEEELL